MSTSPETYNQILAQVKALLSGEKDPVANMANISAVLFNNMQSVNWSGFYLFKQDQLVLGPFQGQPACIRIPMGKGVCGTAGATKSIQIVADVHQFDGHIACDANSQSEIVLPIIVNEALFGVLDIDSPQQNTFNQVDANYLSALIDIFVNTLE